VTPVDDGHPTEHGLPMRYLLLTAAVMVVFLLAFVLVESFGAESAQDPRPWLATGGVIAALVGTGLLVADVLLPVPSSLVMIAHGALFGVPLGAALSLLGAVGAALTGYGLGRWAGPPVLRRVCSARDRERARTLLRRWGLLAVLVSRPVPLVAETVAVVAGAERLGVRRTATAAAIGALPGALLYAAAGAFGSAGPGGLFIFAMVLAVGALLWLLGRRVLRDSTS
jgi:uncharacterized membrane protein YdjX (TVP38/TMEM64 family)